MQAIVKFCGGKSILKVKYILFTDHDLRVKVCLKHCVLQSSLCDE